MMPTRPVVGMSWYSWRLNTYSLFMNLFRCEKCEHGANTECRVQVCTKGVQFVGLAAYDCSEGL